MKGPRSRGGYRKTTLGPREADRQAKVPAWGSGLIIVGKVGTAVGSMTTCLELK